MSEFDELHAAIKAHDLKKIKTLLKEAKDHDEYQNIINRIYKNGDSALSFAIEKGTPKIIAYLLKHGADPFAVNHFGELCLTDGNIQESIIEYMIEYYEGMKISDDDTIDDPEEEED